MRETWAATALAALREAGYRTGGARGAIVGFLAHQRCCVSAQEIYEHLQNGERPVAVASVYRVLDQLSALGLVQRVDIGDATTRYERALTTGDHHHHVVCVDCGRVEPFTDDRLERAVEHAADKVRFAVDAHEVVLRGACEDCRAA